MARTARIWMPVLGALVAASLMLGSASAAPREATQLQRLAPLEASILTRMNEVRVAHGLKPLRLSNGLRMAAVDHSQSMLTYGFFAHESQDGSPFADRLRQFYPLAGFATWEVGENLVLSSARLNGAGAVRAWLNSPPHREDMLSPRWREVGIGALHADSAGGTFNDRSVWVVTMDFGTRTG